MSVISTKMPDIFARMRVGVHPYIDNMFFMGSPEPMLIIAISYLLFVLWLGPKYMKNRQPYNLKWVLIVYNAIQVYICLYMLNMFRAGTQKYPASWMFSFGCKFDPIKHDALGRMVADGVWWYLMTKHLDLLDTVFFVLRKKQNQITFLHVYHHAGMAVGTWVTMKFVLAEELVFMGVLNTFVHSIMYFYYFCSAFGPQMQKYLWWKKYITILQLAQFMIVIMYWTIGLVFGCTKSHAVKIPFGFWIYLMGNGVLFIYLFLDFYWKAYSKENDKKAMNRDENGNTPIENGRNISKKSS